MRRKCDFCGETLDNNDIFCKGCGAKINNEEVKDAIIEGENKAKNVSFLISIIVIFLLIIVLLGLFIIFK